MHLVPRQPEPPTVLVLARTATDAREAANNLGLREWYSPQAHGAESRGHEWSGVVYVDGWRQALTPAARIESLVHVALAYGPALEIEQHDSAWYFRGEALARQAQAVLAAERTARRPSTPVMVAPEVITGHAYTVRRRWWHRITDWLG